MNLFKRLCLTLCVFPCVAMAVGMPPITVPSSDSDILETVVPPGDSDIREARSLRARLAANPDDLRITLQLSRRYLELARREADPRYVGYAEALLTPWLSKPPVPADIKVMYAIVLQATHRFEPAISMLQQSIKQDQRNPQAWLTLASVKQVQGDFPAARSACLGLATTLDAGVATRCLAGLDLLGPQAASAHARLAEDLRQGKLADWEVAALRVALAESAARLGYDKEAGSEFREAMRSGADSYVKAAYADYLLDRKKYSAVISLLRNDQRIDPLLLRLAEASRGAAMDDKQYITALAAGFDAARERGNLTHLREESRFELRLRGNATRALALAKHNWEIQREPADVRVFLEAAAQANDRISAQPVLAWVRKTGLIDVAIQPLVERLGAKK